MERWRNIEDSIMKRQEQDRLTHVEVTLSKLDAKVDVLKNNHLAHMEKSMDSLDKRVEKMDMRIWAIVFGIVTILAATVVGNLY